MRLIDANEFKRKLILELNVSGEYTPYECGLDDAICWLDDAPTIKYGTWIPCSERLPETAGMPCLFTAVNKFEQIRVIKGYTNYMEGGKFQFLSNEKDIDIDCWSVLAWMPLPEQYREEKQ